MPKRVGPQRKTRNCAPAWRLRLAANARPRDARADVAAKLGAKRQ